MVALDQCENIGRDGSHILICTLERLLDFMDKRFVSFEDCRFVVLNEAVNHPTMRPM